MEEKGAHLRLQSKWISRRPHQHGHPVMRSLAIRQVEGWLRWGCEGTELLVLDDADHLESGRDLVVPDPLGGIDVELPPKGAPRQEAPGERLVDDHRASV